MIRFYKLTAVELAIIDHGTDASIRILVNSLKQRFGAISGGDVLTTQVQRPNGFVVEEHFKSF